MTFEKRYDIIYHSFIIVNDTFYVIVTGMIQGFAQLTNNIEHFLYDLHLKQISHNDLATSFRIQFDSLG